MSWTDRLTEMVAGRGLARQSEMRLLERKYADAEQTLKETRSVSFESFESRPDLVSNPRSRLARTGSMPSQLPAESSRRLRPPLYRSQSELPETTRPILESPSGPPDITAIDLSNEDLKRTYSDCDFWDSKTSPLPPLPIMVSYGRFRRSTNASPRWQMEKLVRELSHFDGPMTQKMEDVSLADMGPEVWALYHQHHARSQSIGSRSTQSSSSGCAVESAAESAIEDTNDPKAAPKLSRGFVSSTSSSNGSLFRDASSHFRKDSGLSMTSLSGEAEARIIRQTNGQSLLSLRGGRPPTPLESIAEKTPNLDEQTRGPKKTSKPCIFHANSDTDTALESGSDYESDDDDDEEEEAKRDLTAEDEADAKIPDALTQLLQRAAKLDQQRAQQPLQNRGAQLESPTEGNRPQLTNEVRCKLKSDLQRSNTAIRRPCKAVVQRKSTRGKGNVGVSRNVLSNRLIPILSTAPQTQACFPSEMIALHEACEDAEDQDVASPPKRSTKPSKATGMGDGHSEDKIATTDSGSLTNAHFLCGVVPTVPAMVCKRRDRSSTTIRVTSGNISADHIALSTTVNVAEMKHAATTNYEPGSATLMRSRSGVIGKENGSSRSYTGQASGAALRDAN